MSHDLLARFARLPGARRRRSHARRVRLGPGQPHFARSAGAGGRSEEPHLRGRAARRTPRPTSPRSAGCPLSRDWSAMTPQATASAKSSRPMVSAPTRCCTMPRRPTHDQDPHRRPFRSRWCGSTTKLPARSMTAEADELLERIDEVLPGICGCVVSDYGKGVVTPRLAQELIRRCRERNVPVGSRSEGKRLPQILRGKRW